jgi:hypothetical protein
MTLWMQGIDRPLDVAAEQLPAVEPEVFPSTNDVVNTNLVSCRTQLKFSAPAFAPFFSSSFVALSNRDAER